MLVNAAGVSPSQVPIEAILKVDLYGTAVLLEEVGKAIKKKRKTSELKPIRPRIVELACIACHYVKYEAYIDQCLML